MIPFLLEQHLQGKFPLEHIIKFYDVEDFAMALEEMKSGKVITPVPYGVKIGSPRQHKTIKNLGQPAQQFL